MFAFLGGILPALFWLWFWQREDRSHPEPRGLILLSFLVGILAVFMVLPIEMWINNRVTNITILIALWAFVEEMGKYLAAKFAILRRKDVDEPNDPLMYLITVALGFSALENTLFLLGPLTQGQTSLTIITGNMRFIGATLLHIASSATIGTALALSFYKNKIHKRLFLIVGVILSVALHTIFNFLIMRSGGGNIFMTFAGVWVIILTLLLIFEKVKRVHP